MNFARVQAILQLVGKVEIVKGKIVDQGCRRRGLGRGSGVCLHCVGGFSARQRASRGARASCSRAFWVRWLRLRCFVVQNCGVAGSQENLSSCLGRHARWRPACQWLRKLQRCEALPWLGAAASGFVRYQLAHVSRARCCVARSRVRDRSSQSNLRFLSYVRGWHAAKGDTASWSLANPNPYRVVPAMQSGAVQAATRRSVTGVSSPRFPV